MIYLNCLAKDIANAQEILAATNGHAIIAVQTKDYTSLAEAISGIKVWSEALAHKVSISLGNADPRQGYFVRDVAQRVHAMHANQTFSLVGQTVMTSLNSDMITNALIYPTGTVGQVIISTGPASYLATPAVVSAETAIIMAKEMGARAIKLFTMANVRSDEEFLAVATACAKHQLILEMTGGLTLANIEHWIKLAKVANVQSLIPHVYSAIVDKTTGRTNIDDVRALWAIFTRYYDA